VAYFGVWAGPLPGGHGIAMLFGERYASGASVLHGLYSASNGQGYTGWADGCLPAGQLPSAVVAQQLDEPGKPLVVVGPERATRAEAVLAGGGVVPVPLVGGGGTMGGLPKSVVRVRVYGARGELLGTAVPGQGLQPVP
jgi:hypothetical protein